MMDKVKILVQVEVSADPEYCEQCAWLEHCPPGCRLFRTALELCLAKAPLRCDACVDASLIKCRGCGHAEFYLNTSGMPCCKSCGKERTKGA